VTCIVQKDVLRLQIPKVSDRLKLCFVTYAIKINPPVDNVKFVEVLQGQQELSTVEAGSLLVETLLPL